MKIKVTERHIAMGQIKNNLECPIALALKGTKKFSDVSVGIDNVMLDGKQYAIPFCAIEFIKSFDDYGQNFPSPFEFSIDLRKGRHK